MVDKKKPDIASKLAKLEEINAFFAADKLDIDQGIAKFEEGMQLVKEIRDKLTSYELKIKEIKDKYEL